MLHEADKQRYWASVEQALAVLDFKSDAAAGLRRSLQELPLEVQELFYHAEPLDVAKDLAGLAECSEAQVYEYLQKVQRRAFF